MISRLQPIIDHKKIQVSELYQQIELNPRHPLAQLLRGERVNSSPKSFKQALLGPECSVIAEIKRCSPSKGLLAPIPDPVALASTYVSAGARALSVLTEERFFQGHLKDLEAVAQTLNQTRVPVLRKDFILDKIQIAESLLVGANAILAIVAVLGRETKAILAQAQALGIEVLVEVINEEELEIALNSEAELIVINNRNLHTFEVDNERALRLVEHIPRTLVKVAASGIDDPAIAKRYYQAGFDAVLIGEALVKSSSPADFIRACYSE